MELSIRDWLLIIGVLLLIAIALDGYRRARKERYNQVRLSKNAKRAARQHRPDEVDLLKANEIKPADELLDTAEEPMIADSKIPLDLDEVDPLFADTEIKPPEEPILKQAPLSQLDSQVENTPSLDLSSTEKNDSKENQASWLINNPEEIILLNVMPLVTGEKLDGIKLQTILTACDCRFTGQQVFCRFEQENGQGNVQFTLVNMLEPGIFSEQNLATRSIAGVSLLLCLPGPKNPYEALTCMIETAQCLAKNLNATITDEHLSTVTEQRLAHHRQQVRDFLKRKLLSPSEV